MGSLVFAQFLVNQRSKPIAIPGFADGVSLSVGLNPAIEMGPKCKDVRCSAGAES